VRAHFDGNPLRDNPLVTREHVEQACRDLLRPLAPFHSPGGARVKLGGMGVHFGEQSEALEGFARPLYGIVPLLCGGGSFDGLERYQRGLEAGSDPEHEEFWGFARTDQRMVEMAAIGFALAFAPEHFFEPLSARARKNLVEWLERLNHHTPPDNNWHFFRVIANLGLERVGEARPSAALAESFERIERHYDGAGCYHDGRPGRVDYYVAWAYHTYGLIYASSPLADPTRARRYRERARRFATDFAGFFDARGAAVPFGRSQLYRFAQAAFFGALVLANEEALPWSRIRGLYLRHLRYWARLPIAGSDGVLRLGYAYENPFVCEPYSSAGSPYWCMKYFLALAAPQSHPFWRAEEEPADEFEAAEPRVRSVARAGMVLQRDASQVVMLSAGQSEPYWSNGPAKYGKFAYSSLFGFSVEHAETAPHHGVYDSMLALREVDGPWRARGEPLERSVDGDMIWSVWLPWPDVRVETVLVASGMPWHVRLHRVVTARALASSEQGFALGRDASEAAELMTEISPHGDAARTQSGHGASLILDLARRGAPRASLRARSASVQLASPNTSLIWQRTAIPRLSTLLEPGVHWLACAVAASDRVDLAVGDAPPMAEGAWRFFSALEPA